MAALPSDLSLTNIADGAPIVAADHRNNYSAIAIAVNALIAVLNQGTSGQVYTSDAAGNVVMVNAPGKQAWVGYSDDFGSGGSAWIGANKATLVPFSLYTTQTIDRVHFITGATQSGHFDVGIYDAAGNRQVSKGSTLQSTLTASALNEVLFGSTATLTAGLYYLALAADNGTGTFDVHTSPLAIAKYQRVVSTAFPLPASLTIGTTGAVGSALTLSAPAA